MAAALLRGHGRPGRRPGPWCRTPGRAGRDPLRRGGTLTGSAAPQASLVGQRFAVAVGPVAHGGHCVARHDGRVVFVRHALPGERVTVVVTEGVETSRFLRADAVDVLDPSPDRVDAPCPWAGPGRCGGCDWQHATLAAQRRLKAAVVEEQMRRLAGLDLSVVVEPVEGDDDGLGWRTRVQYAVDGDGRAGLRRHRSHDVVAIDRCRIAHPLVQDADVTSRRWPGTTSVEVAASVGSGRTVVSPVPAPAGAGPGRLVEQAAGREWRVTAAGFWQVHPGAADRLVSAVLDALDPQLGEQALDLYSGVGLFAGALADRVGATGAVVAVEADTEAVKDARRNLHDRPQVALVAARVDRWLAQGHVGAADLVVLDPPRAGAGREVVASIAALQPRAVCYVACDPAALARDTATMRDHGYQLTGLRAFDLFPMTHHVECVATYVLS